VNQHCQSGLRQAACPSMGKSISSGSSILNIIQWQKEMNYQATHLGEGIEGSRDRAQEFLAQQNHFVWCCSGGHHARLHLWKLTKSVT
jgi:hypothetical protein